MTLLPMPDTHCWDDDTESDVWSYSHQMMLDYGDRRAMTHKAERDALARTKLSDQAAYVELRAERDVLRDAAQAGLDALENGRRVRYGEGGTKYQLPLEDAAITQLQAALEGKS